MNEKLIIGEKAVEYIKEGMVVGLGTGSTAYYMIKKLGELVKEGLEIRGIPTSVETERLAKKWGIPLTNFAEVDFLDISIDGADEVNPNMDLIKGGGGALLREKMIAKAAKKFIVVADPSKVVNELGNFLLPVEVVRFGFEMTAKHLSELGCSPHLRLMEGKPFITDNGNFILDCDFGTISNPEWLDQELNMIPGVLENGLFVHMAHSLITMDGQKNILIKTRN